MSQDHQRDENPREGWGEAETPRFLRHLRPPAAPQALRRRVLEAAEAELRVTESSVAASVASGASAGLAGLVDRLFAHRAFWLAWSAALLLLLLLPAQPDLGEPGLGAPDGGRPSLSSEILRSSPASATAARELRPMQWKTGPTVDELRRHRNLLTTEGFFDHEL